MRSNALNSHARKDLTTLEHFASIAVDCFVGYLDEGPDSSAYALVSILATSGHSGHRPASERHFALLPEQLDSELHLTRRS
jgi:hypothetical protein